MFPVVFLKVPALFLNGSNSKPSRLFLLAAGSADNAANKDISIERVMELMKKSSVHATAKVRNRLSNKTSLLAFARIEKIEAIIKKRSAKINQRA